MIHRPSSNRSCPRRSACACGSRHRRRSVGFLHIAARAPTADGKKGDKVETVEIRVALEVRPGRSVVAAKKWRSWGYEVPANKIGILRELVIPGVQLAPKTSKGRDVEVRFPGLRIEIVEPPGNADTVLGCDLLVSLSDLTKQTDRLFEPRLYFADQFLELTVPAGSVKRLGTGDDTPGEPGVNSDPKLVPIMAATATRGVAVFSYAALNGLAQYKTPEGKEVPVNVTVSSTTRCAGRHHHDHRRRARLRRGAREGEGSQGVWDELRDGHGAGNGQGAAHRVADGPGIRSRRTTSSSRT